MAPVDRDKSLDGLSIDDLRARLNLAPPNENALGSLLDAHHALLLLPVGEIIAWQNYGGPLNFRFIAGAPAALSWSSDGPDAQAAPLGSAAHLHQKPEVALDSETWFTSETLGTWTLLQVASPTPLAALTCEKAADDWFPKPRPPQGSKS